MKNEIETVKELTGATDEQIKANDEGHCSRAYIVNDGEFVVKFPRFDFVNYEKEAKVLNHLNTLRLPINIQKVKHLAEDGRCIVLYGVKGTPLLEVNLTDKQRKVIAKQLANAMKQIHGVKFDILGESLDDEILNYEKCFKKTKEFFKKHLSQKEFEELEQLLVRLSKERRDLGEERVFCHGDIFEPNILIDSNGKAGLIDFGNAGLYDVAADFGIDDVMLGNLVLDYYGADEVLRKKVELKLDMCVFTSPHFGIIKYGEEKTAKKWIPFTRKIISKYS